eukprot:symbB.v1.2.033462.t1/scaffold4148.1/size48928/1
MSFVSATNAAARAKVWLKAVGLVSYIAPLARIHPHERLRNSTVSAAARASAELWQLALHLRPRLGGTAEVELIEALERQDVWRPVAKSIQFLKAVEMAEMKHFEATLQKAMDDVKLILDSQKCITLPQDKHHVYEDKFSLAERCSLLSLASQANCFSTVLGLTDEAWLEARACIDRGSEVSLRFRAEERCHFLREETREVEDESQFFSQFSSIGQVLGLTSKTVTKVTEYFWNFEVTYTWELLPQHRVVSSLVHSSELKSQSRQTPRPEVVVPALCEDVIISFLVKHLDFSSLPSVIPRFEIPRGSSKTKTPRRNAEVEEMWCYMTSMSRFLSSIYSYIKTLRQDVVRLGYGQSFPSINAEAIFIPTLPLFVSDGDERVQTGDADGNLTMSVKLEDMQSCMSSANSNRLLEEEMRTLAVKKQEVSDEVEGRGVFSTEEAFCFVALEHSVQVITRWMVPGLFGR